MWILTLATGLLQPALCMPATSAYAGAQLCPPFSSHSCCGSALAETYLAPLRKGMVVNVTCAHAGLRLLPLNLSGAYMPSFFSALYDTQTSVYTAMASIVGICGIVAAFM